MIFDGVGIGASSSDSRMEYTGTTAAGSRIASEGDVTILATGNAEGEGGDLSIIGSQVEGENVTLAAALRIRRRWCGPTTPWP